MSSTKTQNIPTVPLQPSELARSTNGQMQFRPEPMRLRWTLTNLIASDGHKLQGTFACSVRPLTEPAERKVFAEVFLAGKPSVRGEDVVAHFTPTLNAVAANTASMHKAADLLTDEQQKALTDALQKAADKLAFNCGIEILPPLEIELQSPTLQQQKLEQLERNLAEQRVAGQVEHFEKAAALLKQFDAIRQSAPSLAPGAVLQQISPSDQGMMLQTLLLAAGKSQSPKVLWGVAGPSLVRIDPRATPIKIELFSLPIDLGPLRSTQLAQHEGHPLLLVGARSGVIIAKPDALTESPRLYHDQEISSQLGFSRALIWQNQLWACHGEAGVVTWDLNSPDAPKSIFRPASMPLIAASAGASTSTSTEIRHTSPRNLTAAGESRLLFSIGPKLLALDPQSSITVVESTESADIASIMADDRGVYVIREDGGVFVHDPLSLAVTSEERRGGKINAAGVLPWLGSVRLLLVSDEGPVQCLGTQDQLVTQYCSNHRGLRSVTAAVDFVAAVSADRQRLVLWNTWDGRKPLAEVSVSAIARHRLADLNFA
jgi:hypothetical protein